MDLKEFNDGVVTMVRAASESGISIVQIIGALECVKLDAMRHAQDQAQARRMMARESSGGRLYVPKPPNDAGL